MKLLLLIEFLLAVIFVSAEHELAGDFNEKVITTHLASMLFA
jgi:hypothetical protein